MSLTAQRHALLAQNLANLNTANYRRKDMDFNLVLQGELRGPERILELQRKLRGPQELSGASAPIGTNGNDVNLETEVMAIAETELRYQELTDFASGYFSTMKTVIREGR